MTFLTNPGTVRAEPVIIVYGSGDITLMVGMTIVALTGVNGSIMMDTPRMEEIPAVSQCVEQTLWQQGQCL
ncbi:MAG: hypothetical protein ACI4MG_04870 [Aristaeellaceae bacterium]